MPRDLHRNAWRDRLQVAALLSLALVAAGCSGNGNFGGPSATAAAIPPAAAPPQPGAPSFTDKISGFFSGASAKSPQQVANAEADVTCPFIDIRDGASTLMIPPPTGDNNAMALKYQGTFVRAARECAVANGQMVMKVGVEGRIIVGPAGGPGQVDVPLRLAVVDSPVSGAHTIVTKLIRIPVSVGTTDAYTTFTHIEEGLAFPLPSSAALENYLVYIGFDPIGAEALAKPKPAAKPKPKAKPNPNAPTG